VIYLATPYTSHPGGFEQAFKDACRYAAIYLEAGVPVFAPIAHGHAVEPYLGEKRGHDFWMPLDLHYLSVCSRLLVVLADGVEESKGINMEIEAAEKLPIPISYVPAVEGTMRWHAARVAERLARGEDL